MGTGVSIFQVCDNISNLKFVEASLDHQVADLKSKKSELEEIELQVQNTDVSVDLALKVKRSGYTIGKAIENSLTLPGSIWTGLLCNKLLFGNK